MSILEKEAVYREQMAPIREEVMSFANKIRWEPLSRGRKAHVSLFGAVNGFDGVIDIEIERLDWDDMPDKLSDDYPFTLWCSASKTISGNKYHSRQELYWECSFKELPLYASRFLDAAWLMLSNLTDDDLLD